MTKEMKKTRSFRAFVAMVKCHSRANSVELSWYGADIPTELISEVWRRRWHVSDLWVRHGASGLWQVNLQSTESYERHSGEGETLREALLMAKHEFMEHQKKQLTS